MNLGAGKLKHMEHGKTEPRLQPVGDVKWFQSTGKGNRLWIPQAGKVHQTQEELYWSITCINQNVWIPTGAVTGATSVGRYWSVLGLGFTRQLLWPWRSSHCRDVRKQQHHVSGKLLVLVMNKPQSILLLSVERVSWFFLRRWRDFEAFFFPVRESNLWSFQKHLRFFFCSLFFEGDFCCLLFLVGCGKTLGHPTFKYPSLAVRKRGGYSKVMSGETSVLSCCEAGCSIHLIDRWFFPKQFAAL